MIAIACPQCGKEFEAEAVSVLTPGSPHLRDLLSGTLNCTACPQSGSRLNIPCRLIFRDAENPYMLIQERRPSTREGLQKLVQNVEAAATQAAMSQGLERPELRMVFSRPEFIEKISIHKLGFDDRLIEYAKLQLFRNMDELQLSRLKHRLLLDYSRTNDEHLLFLVYDRETQKPINAIQVEMSDYLSLEEELMKSEDLQRELDAAFPGCHVSADRLI